MTCQYFPVQGLSGVCSGRLPCNSRAMFPTGEIWNGPIAIPVPCFPMQFPCHVSGLSSGCQITVQMFSVFLYHAGIVPRIKYVRFGWHDICRTLNTCTGNWRTKIVRFPCRAPLAASEWYRSRGSVDRVRGRYGAPMGIVSIGHEHRRSGVGTIIA